MMPFAAAWVDLEIIMLSGLGPAEKDKCHVTLLVCGILKKRMQVHITLQEVKCDRGEFLTHQNTRFCKF